MASLDFHLGGYVRAAMKGAPTEALVGALVAAAPPGSAAEKSAFKRLDELKALSARCQHKLVNRCIISAHHFNCLRAAFPGR